VKREEIKAITGGCFAVPTSSYADIYAEAIDELWAQIGLDSSKKPHITFIVVGKGCDFQLACILGDIINVFYCFINSHHVRFFPDERLVYLLY
jgi:hypothetical protein